MDDTIALLARIWPRLPAAMARAEAFGARWSDHSTPFVHKLDGRVVAHVGVWPIEVVLAGQTQTVAAVHAVCSDPNERGRGYFRATLERALAWIDARWPTAVLWANNPAIYTSFGFELVEESIFIEPLRALPSHDGPTPGPGAGAVQALSLEHGPDVELLRAALARRTPVSRRAATAEPGGLALMDLALWSPGPSLALIPELDAIIVYAIRGRFLDLYDVIAERIPSLAEIAGRLGPGIDTAVVHFTPDLLDLHADRVEASALPDTLMVRGDWPVELGPIAFSPIARC